jgi:hypothetical protein
LRCDGKLLSPERRRRAVAVLQERYRASERLVWRVVVQHRSTQRHGGKVVDLPPLPGKLTPLYPDRFNH